MPAYLDPSLDDNELLTGVSFASGGTGYDLETPKIASVLSFADQLNQFKEYIMKVNDELSSMFGRKQAGVEKFDFLNLSMLANKRRDISLASILNCLSKAFCGICRNYNMHNMGKGISKSHNVLGIAPVAIIDRQLPFEYTIASRTTGVMVMVLRVERKLFVTEQPISLASPTNSEYLCSGMWYLIHNEATDLIGIIHTDVCGLLRHVSRQGASYFITFTDDYSRYGYVYLLKHKHEVFETFKVFKNEVENQLGKTIKALRSDRGGEYISQEFKDYLKDCGIVQQLTPPYTPQHNGVSERRNRTLLNMVRSMMNLTTLPLSFWDYALESATRILNMVPTKKVDKTPYELWYGKVPNLSYLKVWGCEALVKRDTPDKLQQRSVKCIFIGYPKETMGYYFYFPPENKIVVARYAEFFEKNLITQEVSGRAEGLEEIQDEDTSPSEITSEIPMEVEGFEPPQEEVIPIRRSGRTHRALNRLCLNVEAEEHSLGDLNEPTSYKAAMLDSESNKWIDAMNAEMQSMMDNMVWVLVDLPPGCKTVGSKWIFKKKTDMDGFT
ncbi:retrotransposon protein, putative, ty1-copia subclass [Tanacetum coccineum]